jgi:hypothetical protein
VYKNQKNIINYYKEVAQELQNGRNKKKTQKLADKKIID